MPWLSDEVLFEWAFTPLSIVINLDPDNRGVNVVINPDAEIFIKGKIVGKITSSFSLNDKFVSLGLINREYNSDGEEIEIENQKCLVSDNIFKKINEKIVEL